MTVEPRTSLVTIYTGDYLDRIRHLEAQANAEKDAAPPEESRLASDIPAYLRIAEEHDALVAEAEAQARHIRVRAVPRRTVWKPLLEKHPPRVGDERDEAYGFNDATLREDLVPAAIVEVIDPDETRVWADIPELKRDEVLDDLPDIDFDRVYYAALSLVRVPEGDPKGSLVSRLTQKSDETSNSPAASE